MNMRIPPRRPPGSGRWAGPSRRAATAVLAAIALVLTALVAGLAAPKASAATCGTTNIALHQPTTASSIQGPCWPASNATDGNLSTRWSSAFSDPQWLEVDLGSTQSICQVVIHWETAYAKAFQIQTSNDNSTWTTIYSTTTGTGGTQTLNITGSGRYIRMYGTVRATQYGYSIYEFQVYAATGTGNTVTVTNPGTQTWTVGTAASLQIQATDSASGQTLTYSATGLPAGLSINSSTGLISGTPTATGTGSATVTAKDTTGASGSATFSWTVNAAGHRLHRAVQPAELRPERLHLQPERVRHHHQQHAEHHLQRAEGQPVRHPALRRALRAGHLHRRRGQRRLLRVRPGPRPEPRSVAAQRRRHRGLLRRHRQRHATTSGGRVENMEITPSAGNDRWAVAQAGPFHRMDINGGLELYPASYGYASGGYIADSKVTGQVSSVSQQQWYSQDSNFGSWSGVGLEHGVLRRERRARAELPQPADDHAGHHPGVAGRPVPLRRLLRQLQRVRAVAADQRVRPELGQRLDSRHVASR